MLLQQISKGFFGKLVNIPAARARDRQGRAKWRYERRCAASLRHLALPPAPRKNQTQAPLLRAEDREIAMRPNVN
jgi:hypothetical protein